MLDKSASFTALVLLRQRLCLFEFDREVHFEQAGTAFFSGDEACRQRLLRFIKMSGGRQIAGQLED